MLIEDLVKIENNQFKVDFDTLSDIKEFDILQYTEQNPFWHSEGNVWIHTQNVVNEAINIFNDVNNPLHRIMVAVALLHDVGKGVTTILDIEKHKFSSPNHAEEGANLIDTILDGESTKNIDIVKWYVKNHMKPLEIYFDVNLGKTLQEISMSTDYPTYCNIKNLLLLKHCDCVGSFMLRYDFWREKLDFIKQIAIEYGCFDKRNSN